MLSVHAIHRAVQSSFQAQNTTTTGWPRGFSGWCVCIVNLRLRAEAGFDSLIRLISDGRPADSVFCFA